MSQGDISVRGCKNDSELKAVVDLCDIAFPNTNREYFERHIYRDGTLSPSDTRILLKNDKIVSSVQVFPRSIYLNGRIIKMGGIGNVATLPEERRNGYAGMLLVDAIEYMRSRDMQISMLTTTINNYYERFGFQTIKRHVFVCNIGNPVRNNNIRRFDLRKDLNAVMGLYESYNRAAIGSIARDLKYWNFQINFSDDDKDLFLVYELNEEVIAYTRSKRLDDRLKVLEYSFAGQNSELITALLRHSMFEARRDKIELFISEREKSRLPFIRDSDLRIDTDLMIRFLSSGLTIEEKELLLKENYITFWMTDFF
ncbi:MAG: GNAT family N-acetyltransferase [Candidatus Kryptoniota bacterium]